MNALSKFRKGKDEFFKTDSQSPLSDEQKSHFIGLHYYPENQELRFEAKIKRFQEQAEIVMQTSSGDVQHYLRLGTITFQVDGQEATLTVYGADNSDAFVPFTDATSGVETYGAGRYMDLQWRGGDRFLVDLNKAYNPWCAYSPYYSCPLPPVENRLKVAIRAGEKNYDGYEEQQ